MPITMKVKCFILFFAVFIVIGASYEELEFYNCGSYLDIKGVSVSNCHEAPCVFSPGDNFTVEIISEAHTLDFTELDTKAYLWMFGHKWPLEINPQNPCTQWRCPVVEANPLNYTADVHMLDNVMRRPAHIEVAVTYETEGNTLQALCIEFDITIQ